MEAQIRESDDEKCNSLADAHYARKRHIKSSPNIYRINSRFKCNLSINRKRDTESEVAQLTHTAISFNSIQFTVCLLFFGDFSAIIHHLKSKSVYAKRFYFYIMHYLLCFGGFSTFKSGWMCSMQARAQHQQYMNKDLNKVTKAKTKRKSNKMWKKTTKKTERFKTKTRKKKPAKFSRVKCVRMQIPHTSCKWLLDIREMCAMQIVRVDVDCGYVFASLNWCKYFVYQFANDSCWMQKCKWFFCAGIDETCCTWKSIWICILPSVVSAHRKDYASKVLQFLAVNKVQNMWAEMRRACGEEKRQERRKKWKV